MENLAEQYGRLALLYVTTGRTRAQALITNHLHDLQLEFCVECSSLLLLMVPAQVDCT